MKRIIGGVFCAAVLCLGFAGCDDGTGDLANRPEAQPRPQPTATVQPAGAGKVGLKSDNAGGTGDAAGGTRGAAEGETKPEGN